MHPAIAVSLVFAGCMLNNVFLELIIREAPSSGNFFTFSQFFFIALQGFIFTADFGRKSPIIPIRCYFNMVAFFFITSVINNYAFNFNVAVPLHMIFRAGSLVANLCLGVIILKRSYKLSKYISVLMITAGIAICTVVSANKVEVHHTATTGNPYTDYLWWCVGITMLVVALFLSARLGIYQEQLYSQFGKHPTEALFYAHALPLPGFLFLGRDIYKHVMLFTASEPLYLYGMSLIIPKLWLYTLGNVVTQYICIRAVYVLTSETTSLTVTLVVTLRKFFSLMFSIFYFKNPFTVYHWIGTVLVFTGTFIFVELFQKIQESLSPPVKKEKSQ
ncbi:UDP-xylose and UDP-N-acetylglucosamine transporter [Exaiptasia diaphana]|uniref:UDP-xylose and UDP-N-acetylglucosamine transporter n=1 Tax=Exaiptasia diaphana TaxID=2652724 RepID=A0A913X359_EXADI|nr:UDP-xylose and UDP-N-acetylglucosamine transporter [Exaiptasia diaphana]